MAIRKAPTNRGASKPQSRPVSTKRTYTAQATPQSQQRNVGGVYTQGGGGSGGGGAQEPGEEKAGGLSDLLKGNNKYIVIAVALLAVYFLFLRKKR